ncbi:hypothetical protein [Actinoallomurus spadix]|uniref:Uncharacterized protein n=1 Tax=Actinoallomurus spadix TaxID=79912 RepID=A0ABP3GQ99_9ACTN
MPPIKLGSLLNQAQAERPDIALFMVSGFLSDTSKDHFRTYVQQNRPPFRIKWWERPDLERLFHRRQIVYDAENVKKSADSLAQIFTAPGELNVAGRVAFTPEGKKYSRN